MPQERVGRVLSLWDELTSQLCSGDQAHVRHNAMLARDEQARPRFAPFTGVRFATDPCISPHDADYWILPAVRSSTGSVPRRRSALLLSVGMQ